MSDYIARVTPLGKGTSEELLYDSENLDSAIGDSVTEHMTSCDGTLRRGHIKILYMDANCSLTPEVMADVYVDGSGYTTFLL